MSTKSLVEGTANFRDVAASPGIGAAGLRPGVYLRSDGLASVTQRGLKQFAGLNVHTVIDLRAAQEAALDPDVIPAGVETLSVPLLQGRQDAPLGLDLGELPALAKLYASMLQNSSDLLASIVEAVAASPGPTVVHCTAGKDRTGVSTALILAAVGVDRESIVADYALTESRLTGAWERAHVDRLQEHGVEVTAQLRELLVGSPPEAMEATLTLLETGFGGAEDYLRSAGVSAATLTALRHKLLV